MPRIHNTLVTLFKALAAYNFIFRDINYNILLQTVACIHVVSLVACILGIPGHLCI
jgi:hypothetical protein